MVGGKRGAREFAPAGAAGECPAVNTSLISRHDGISRATRRTRRAGGERRRAPRRARGGGGRDGFPRAVQPRPRPPAGPAGPNRVRTARIQLATTTLRWRTADYASRARRFRESRFGAGRSARARRGFGRAPERGRPRETRGNPARAKARLSVPRRVSRGRPSFARSEVAPRSVKKKGGREMKNLAGKKKSRHTHQHAAGGRAESSALRRERSLARRLVIRRRVDSSRPWRASTPREIESSAK